MIIPPQPKLTFKSASIVTVAILAVCIIVMLIDLDTKSRLLKESEKLQEVIREGKWIAAGNTGAATDSWCLSSSNHCAATGMEASPDVGETTPAKSVTPRRNARKSSGRLPSGNSELGA